MSPLDFFPKTICPLGLALTPDRCSQAVTSVEGALLSWHKVWLDLGRDLPYQESNFLTSSVNSILSIGSQPFQKLRTRLQEALQSPHKNNINSWRLSQAQLLQPFHPTDFVDFYAGIHHAQNVGTMFRGPDQALPVAYKHLPIGYHGRTGSLSIETKIRRPKGQFQLNNELTFGATTELDFELELGAVMSPCSGELSPKQAWDEIFGFTLVNDWSARDIQRWEYRPLGPFLGKSFATTVSPWIIPKEVFPTMQPQAQNPQPLAYLTPQGPHPDIAFEVWLRPAGETKEYCLSRSHTQHLYWTFGQMIAHIASNGTTIHAGDLYASGTISGTQPQEAGSLLEINQNKTRPISGLNPNPYFLNDGDSVTFKALFSYKKQQVQFSTPTVTIVQA